MPIEVEFDGTVHEFPDDFTDADIAAALEARAPAPVQGRGGTIGADTRVGGRLRDAAQYAEGVPGILVGAGKQAAQSAGDLLGGAGRLLERVTGLELPDLPQAPIPLESANTWQSLGERGTQAAELYGGARAVAGVPGVIARGTGISRARAGQQLDDVTRVMTEGVDIPGAGRVVPRVNALDTVRETGQRAQAMQAAGGRMPRAASRLMTRIQDGGDLSWQEAADFASNLSRLSANEFNALNPQMQRQITQMSTALREALTTTANSVGQGEKYAAGIREYGRAANLEKKWEATKPVLMRTLRRIGYAGAAGAGYRLSAD